jgi:hypothetical protein
LNSSGLHKRKINFRQKGVIGEIHCSLPNLLNRSENRTPLDLILGECARIQGPDTQAVSAEDERSAIVLDQAVATD